MPRNPSNVSTRRRRIAELAKRSAQMSFTSLAHLLDLDWLREAYQRTRKDGAAGVDGQTSRDYAANLEGNLRSLLDRVKAGHYQSPPVRRVHIPKGSGGETRPIGIPTFEDKVLQRAVVMLLEPIYEQDFSNDSYGFPGTIGASGASIALGAGDASAGRMDLGSRHLEVLRQPGSSTSSRASPASSARRSYPPAHR